MHPEQAIYPPCGNFTRWGGPANFARSARPRHPVHSWSAKTLVSRCSRRSGGSRYTARAPADSRSARGMPPDRTPTGFTPSRAAVSMSHTVSPTNTARSLGTPCELPTCRAAPFHRRGRRHRRGCRRGGRQRGQTRSRSRRTGTALPERFPPGDHVQVMGVAECSVDIEDRGALRAHRRCPRGVTVREGREAASTLPIPGRAPGGRRRSG